VTCCSFEDEMRAAEEIEDARTLGSAGGFALCSCGVELVMLSRRGQERAVI
jgi:hypothetical protein